MAMVNDALINVLNLYVYYWIVDINAWGSHSWRPRKQQTRYCAQNIHNSWFQKGKEKGHFIHLDRKLEANTSVTEERKVSTMFCYMETFYFFKKKVDKFLLRSDVSECLTWSCFELNWSFIRLILLITKLKFLVFKGKYVTCYRWWHSKALETFTR